MAVASKQPNLFLPLVTCSILFDLLNLFSIGGVRMIDCLDANVTEFPPMTEEELVEFCGGSYLVDLVRSYVTYYQQQKLDRNEQPYLNLAHYHNDRRNLSQSIEYV